MQFLSWRSVILIILVVLTPSLLMMGCAATHTAISKRDLDVQTKMSDTIFLDPVGPDKKVIFVQVRNTSDKPNFDLEKPIKDAMTAKGYRVTEDPDEAHYQLLANVLSVGKADPSAAEAALNGGYGGALAGGATGAAVGAATGGWRGGFIGGALGAVAGSAIETVSGAYVKDVTFMGVTDIQLAERAKKGVIVRQDSQQDLAQGIGGSRRQTSSEVTNLKKYRTRIVSTANKANLEYDEAAPLLTDGLTRSLSGLF